MRNLNKIVRRVLLEAAPTALDGEFQDGALVVTGKPSPDEERDAELARIENYISPNAHVDPGAFIEHSIIGYRFMNARVNKSDVGDDTQIMGDSAVSASLVSDSIVKNSVVAESGVRSAALTDCDLAYSDVRRSKLKSCTLRDRSSVSGISASNSSFEATNVRGGVGDRVGESVIRGSELTRCPDVILSGKSIIEYCTVANTKIEIENGAVTSATIDKSALSDSIRIRGAEGSEVVIKNSQISGNAAISATKTGQAPQLIGAIVSENANVSDSAFVSGRVKGNAVVFGNARIEPEAIIMGKCRVGGTAVMVSGVWEEGLYTEGRHVKGERHERLYTPGPEFLRLRPERD
jgi:hypothetical protein